MPRRIPHDLRRAAVFNLERAEVPCSTATALIGHRTKWIYRRYPIDDEASLLEAAAKLARQHDLDVEAPAEAAPAVVSIKQGAGVK